MKSLPYQTYGLDQTADRVEILQFITENIFYHNNPLI